ncbi:MAG: glycosyltransferase family 2 protein [Vicinamibacterales bacterium]
MTDETPRATAGAPASQLGVAVSVVIPAHNDARNLVRLLTALTRELPRAVSGEIIVVANGCRDDSVAVCHRFDVVCLERPPLAPAAARNAGAALARGRWLAFLDADTEPGQAWFDGLAELVGGRSGEGSEIAGWPCLAPAGAGWVAQAWQHVRFAPSRLPGTLDCGNLIISRRLFDEIGGFNANRIAGEDVELCESAIAHGHRPRFDARLVVFHYGEPAGLGQFFSRELFHADPLATVLHNCRRSIVDLSILLLVVFGVTGFLGLVAAGLTGDFRFALPAAGALTILTVAALAKAAIKWTGTVRLGDFLRMVFLCQVMLTARALGTLIRRQMWRSAPPGTLQA